MIHLSHRTSQANQTNLEPKGGVFSVCSTNQFIIQTALEAASGTNGLILIEATANQVNLSGGYSGLTPHDFVHWIHHIAENMGLPANRYIIGMDHLGPHAWPEQSSEDAFKNSAVLVRHSVKAGFRKFHIDLVSGVPGSHGNIAAKEKAALRTADLCRVAEETAKEESLNDDLFYVIGTDVPAPGGGLQPDMAVTITDPKILAQTLSVFQSAFFSAGLKRAWERVAAVVVQPGVDFDDFNIADYNHKRAAALTAYHQHLPHGMTYEVHAADFQKPEALKKMVQDRFNLLKIGPCLTFALRQTLYTLAHIEEALPDIEQPSRLRQAMESIMVRDPTHWRSHYQGKPEDLAYLRHFGLRDRIRYYWAYPQARKAVTQLLHNLNRTIPQALLKQYLPDLPDDLLPANNARMAETIIDFRLHQALKPYENACWAP